MAVADAVVVGSAVIERIAGGIGDDGIVDKVHGFVRELAGGLKV